jgi:hypothetical protein
MGDAMRTRKCISRATTERKRLQTQNNEAVPRALNAFSKPQRREERREDKLSRVEGETRKGQVPPQVNYACFVTPGHPISSDVHFEPISI